MTRSRPILVVDDNPETREAILRILAFRGYPVVGVPDAVAALAFLYAQDAALVILDIAMPVMSGMEFLELRDRDPDLARIPVIVYSAYRNDGFRNICGYAAKHDDPDRLLELVERCRLRTYLPTSS